MAVPDFLAGALNTDFRYFSRAGVTDVNTIISDLNTELIALGWTDASGVGTGPFKTPTRADGAFIVLTLARTSAVRLSLVVTDPAGMVVTPAAGLEVDIDAGGTEIRLYTGKFHVCIDSARVTPEAFYCAILDRSPEELALPRPIYVCSYGPRSNLGAITNQSWCSHYGIPVDGVAYAACNGTSSWVVERGIVAAGLNRLTVSGALMPVPFEFGKDGWLMGRMPQALIIDGGQVYGTEITVPLDTGVTGIFKVAGFSADASGKLMFRKA